MTHQPLPHDYYYADEADQFSFYRLPKALFANEQYQHLSSDSKILYGLMLDRMGLSVKNGWLDDYGKVYIYFTLDDVQGFLNCKRDKGMKLLAELDDMNGVGLIERKRQGQGKPAIIYVKKFKTGTDLWRSKKPTSALQDSSTSRRRNNRPLDYDKTDPNNTKYNKNNSNDTDLIKSSPDEMDADEYRREIRHRLDYYAYLDDPYDSIEQLDELIELMVEIQCTSKPTILISGSEYPTELVKQRFSRITGKHIEYIIGCFKENTTKIYKIKPYLLAALFNAPATVEHFYTAEFNHLYNGGNIGKE